MITVLIRFDVEPGEQEALLATIRPFAEEVMARQPGFIDATLHKSLDGRSVFNVAHWESREAYEAALADEEVGKAGEGVAAFGPTATVADVAFSVTKG